MKTIQEEPLYVMADGRKTWRVFENLYGNIYKYAMDNTRVYVDITRQNDKVVIFIRNISASPLNFNAKELTERFVRGDKSRTTEGSGLGLSIAKLYPNTKVDMVDISERALDLARQNKSINTIENAEIFASDSYQNITKNYE